MDAAAAEQPMARYVLPVYRIENNGPDPHHATEIIGMTEQMRTIFADVDRLSNRPATVLITGETGTGKGLVAQALHYNGQRAAKRFARVNCAAVPSDILESELFGHERGAYTGASSDKPGTFRSADGGTVFLDEIGEMPPMLQAKLLQVVEDKTFTPVGSSSEVRVDVRIIASTNKDIQAEVEHGVFRRDLYHRLNVVPISMPPLRHRMGDMEALIQYFLNAFNREYKKRVESLEEDAFRWMQGYRWPGNVRELKDIIERPFAARDNGDDSRIKLKELRISNESSSLAANKFYPILISRLAEIDGAFTFKTLRERGVDGIVPYENVGDIIVFYLTAETAAFCFSRNTRAYGRLLEKIEKFCRKVRGKFGVYSVRTLSEELEVDKNILSKVLVRRGIMALDVDQSTRSMIITESNRGALHEACQLSGIAPIESNYRMDNFYNRLDARYSSLVARLPSSFD